MGYDRGFKNEFIEIESGGIYGAMEQRKNSVSREKKKSKRTSEKERTPFGIKKSGAGLKRLTNKSQKKKSHRSSSKGKKKQGGSKNPSLSNTLTINGSNLL